MKEQILNTSDEAAKRERNISGWVDRQGRFWGEDERMARWSGCTHLVCPTCGKIMSKNYTLCRGCREEKAIKRHKARKSKLWDRITPLYSDAFDEYFLSWDEVLEYLFDIEYPEEAADDLRLLICEPMYLPEITEDYFTEYLPENNEELPENVQVALNGLNKAIKNEAPVSWEPGKYKAEIEKIKVAK